MASSFARICAASTLFDECAREQAKSAAQMAGLNKIWIIRRIGQLLLQPTPGSLNGYPVFCDPCRKRAGFVVAGPRQKRDRSGPAVQFIRHVGLDKVENNEIMAQFPAAVLATFHIRLEIVPEQGYIQC